MDMMNDLVFVGITLWVLRHDIAAKLRGLTYREYLETRLAELERAEEHNE